jgi:hypothetical protein
VQAGKDGGMDDATYLSAVPDVERHRSLAGPVRAVTFAHLARRHGVPLPTSRAAHR